MLKIWGFWWFWVTRPKPGAMTVGGRHRIQVLTQDSGKSGAKSWVPRVELASGGAAAPSRNPEGPLFSVEYTWRKRDAHNE